MPEANIITGQYVQISQSPASLGERIVAQIIDDFLIICYLVGVSLLIAELDFFYRTKMLFFLIAIYLPALFYHFLMELFNHGQSVGKMVMRIRVVKKDGTTPGIGDFFMRWLLQLVDLGFSGVGALVILISKNSQRLGDLAAGTMVIQLNDYRKIKSHLTNSLTLIESINLSIHKLKTSLLTNLMSSNVPSIQSTDTSVNVVLLPLLRKYEHTSTSLIPILPTRSSFILSYVITSISRWK